MRIEDEIAKKFELARLKDSGIEKLASVAPLSKNPALEKKLQHILDTRILLVDETHPYLSPYTDQLMQGQILIGNNIRMDGSIGPQIFLPIEILTRYPHILVTGASGTGKSTTVKHLITQFTQHGVGSLLLDSENDYPHLLTYLPEGDCWVFDDRNFKRNPLQPLPEEERRRTYGRVKRVFRETFLRDGSIGLLGEELIELSPLDLVNPITGREPTLKLLFQQLDKIRYRLDSRRGQYLESLKNRLGNVVEFVDMYDCIEGFNITDWLTNRCIILSLAALSDELKDFVVNELLACIQDWTLQNPNPDMRLVITVDEAHRFFSPKKAQRYDLGDPIILDAARTFRKRGVNLILSTQVFHDLPVAALANISTFLVFRTSEGSCIRAVGQALSLTREQMEYLPKLGERRAVLKHPLIPEPFIVELPELDFSRSVSKQEIRGRMAPVLERLRWVPSSYEEAPAVSGSTDTANVAGERKRNQSQEQRMAPLAKETLDYLEAIAKQPFMPATERDRKIGTSTYKGNRLRDKLRKAGLIEIHQVNLGKRGSVITLVEITNKGWGVVKAYNMDVKKPIGKGSFIHQFWQHKVREWFIENRKECKVGIEQSVEGKSVDVGAEIEGKKVAVEIMIKGEEKELTNILKDIETGWDEVIVCSENNEIADSLRGRLKEISGDRYKGLVSFKELREFAS